MGELFRTLLRDYRIAAGLTQEALAERALLSGQAVGALERGDRRFPRQDTVARIADALGLDERQRDAFVAAAPTRGGRPADGEQDANSPADLPPGSRPGRQPRELPANTYGFIGRTDQLAELDKLLASADRPGTVAVCGTAGVGKTALAVHWAHSVAHAFPDGQLYVDLRGYGPDQPMEPADALVGFLRGLGLASAEIPQEQAERASRYRTVLAERRTLIVLDNARHFEQVRDLLPGAPGCLVVVTSRDMLAGLGVRHGVHRVTLDPLPAAEARELLRVHVGDRVDCQPEAAAALVEQCARLPLALRIAAQLVATRPAATLDRLVGELVDEQDRLALLDTGDPRGSASVVFSWSYRNLPAGAAALFRLLGVHPGRHVDAHAAAALAGTDLRTARSQLTVLARAHLVQEKHDGKHVMHDLLRAYAARLTDDNDDEDVRHAALTRLFDYYVAAAAAAMDRWAPFDRHLRPEVTERVAHVPAFPDRAAALAWLDAERANLVAVGAHAAEHGRPGHTTRLASILYRYLSVGAHYAEADLLHHAAVRAAATPSARGDALVSLGTVAWRRGRLAESLDCYRRALEIFRETGNRAGEARALINRGVTYRWLGRHTEAAEHHRRAIALLREVGDAWSEARGRDNLGLVEHGLGRYPEALEQQERALELYRRTGDTYGEAGVRGNLGVTYARLGRHAEALDHLERALASLREVGDRRGESETLNDLATTLHDLGQHAEAAERHRQALARAEAVGDRYEQRRANTGLARCHEALGDPDAALAHRRAAGDPPSA